MKQTLEENKLKLFRYLVRMNEEGQQKEYGRQRYKEETEEEECIKEEIEVRKAAKDRTK